MVPICLVQLISNYVTGRGIFDENEVYPCMLPTMMLELVVHSSGTHLLGLAEVKLCHPKGKMWWLCGVCMCVAKYAPRYTHHKAQRGKSERIPGSATKPKKGDHVWRNMNSFISLFWCIHALLPHKVKMQYVHFKLHTTYFLLPLMITEKISRWSMLFNN